MGHLRQDIREIRQLRGRLPPEKLAELSRIKLDIGDVKTKRFFKERARKEAMGDIVPMIVKVKTARLLAQSAFEHGEATCAGVVEEERRKGIQPPTSNTSESSCASATHASSRASATQARRRHARQRYSDEELTHLLKED